MSINDIYSNRNRKQPDVYIYDAIPKKIRVQIIYVFKGIFDIPIMSCGIEDFCKYIYEILCKEYGFFSNYDHNMSSYTCGGYISYSKQLFDYFLNEDTPLEHCLDIIELICKIIIRYDRHRENVKEINERLMFEGIGYQFENGQIIRCDSEFTHKEIVKPALSLIQDDMFKGVNDEFMNAHKYYRENKYEETLVYCSKALESTLKIICKSNSWEFDEKSTIKPLFTVVLSKNLIPPFWQSHFEGLRSCLENGVSVARNKIAGHGQGDEVREVPHHIAEYVINSTAAAIKLLIEADKNK